MKKSLKGVSILAFFLVVVFSSTAIAANYYIVFPVDGIASDPKTEVNEDSEHGPYLKLAFIPHSDSGDSLTDIVSGEKTTIGEPIVWNEDGSITSTIEEQFSKNGIRFDTNTDSFVFVVDLYFGRHVSQTGRRNILGFRDLVGSSIIIALGEYGNSTRLWSRIKYTDSIPSSFSRSDYGVPYNKRVMMTITYDPTTRISDLYFDGVLAFEGAPFPSNKNQVFNDALFSFGGAEERFYGSFLYVKENDSFTESELDAIISSPYSSINL